MQNAVWSTMILENRLNFPYFRKGMTTHSTLADNDRRQETLTGFGTTDNTNKTIFQVLSTEEMQNLLVVGEQERLLFL